jgi:hypothetical protein
MMLRANRSIALLVALPLLLLFAAPPAHASVPGAPINVSAVDTLDASGTQLVRVSWSVDPNGGLPQYFLLYCGDDPTTTRNIATVYMQTPDSGLTWNQYYSYDVLNLASGTYTFYVTAVNADGTSQPSAFVHVTIQRGSAGIRWLSSPPSSGIVGIPYVYDADAVSSNQEDPHYTGVSLPAGASIDSVTGVVSYTASAVGKQIFTINA